MKNYTNGNLATVKRPSIDHVADLAKVSRITVARVFSNPSMVSDKTRKKVLKASKMLNYRSNPLARALAGGKTNTVGVIWEFARNASASEITGLVTYALQNRGYMVHVSGLTGEFESTLDLLTEYAERRLEAVVVQVVDDWLLHKEFRNVLSHFPAVVLVTDELKPLPFDQVVCDRLGAIRDVASHFAKSGRKRPCRIRGSVGSVGEENKEKAFLEQLKLEGLDGSVDSSVLKCDFDSVNDMSEFLDRKFPDGKFPYDAVMCSNDDLAACMISWLSSHGLKVPGDVAIAGFNDAAVCKFFNPPIASTARRAADAVKVIDELLTNRLENPDELPQIREVPMGFVWRESAGK